MSQRKMQGETTIIHMRIESDLLEAVAARLMGGEIQTDFIRFAIEREVAARHGVVPQPFRAYYAARRGGKP